MAANPPLGVLLETFGGMLGVIAVRVPLRYPVPVNPERKVTFGLFVGGVGALGLVLLGAGWWLQKRHRSRSEVEAPPTSGLPLSADGWIVCPHCRLRRRQRSDSLCPRCHKAIGLRGMPQQRRSVP
jgi:uncharacterized paraquat-inducible protein A